MLISRFTLFLSMPYAGLAADNVPVCHLWCLYKRTWKMALFVNSFSIDNLTQKHRWPSIAHSYHYINDHLTCWIATSVVHNMHDFHFLCS